MAKYIKISVQVNEDVWLAFKNHVLSKYGSLRGFLGEELSKAIDYYLSHVTPAHTQENEHIISKPNKRHIKLLTWIAQRSQYEITQSDIEDFIVENFGVDWRTKKKYLRDFLIRMGFIELKRALYGKNNIYEVKFDRIYNYLKRFLKEDELKKLGIVPEEVKVERSGIPVEVERESKESIKDFALERYEAGDSFEEISDKIADFGLNLSKRAVRNLVKKARRENHV